MISHCHAWSPDDTGMGKYSCECGLAAKRSWKDGRFHIQKGAQPEQTVCFKTLGPGPDEGGSDEFGDEYETGSVPSSRLHSTRRHSPDEYALERNTEIALTESKHTLAESFNWEGVGDSALLNAAWREWQNSEGFSGTNETLHALPVPPPWFVGDECGFGLAYGTNLRETCRTLAKQNRAAVRALGDDAPYRVSWPRPLPEPTPIAEPSLEETMTQFWRRWGG